MKRIIKLAMLSACMLGILIVGSKSFSQSSTVSTFNFENSLNFWKAAASNPDAGSLSIAEGESGFPDQALRFDTTQQGWFGVGEASGQFPIVTDQPKTITVALSTLSDGTQVSVAVQFGDSDLWCQSKPVKIAANSQKTLTVNAALLVAQAGACVNGAPSDATDVRGIWVYFSGTGTYLLDDVSIK